MGLADRRYRTLIASELECAACREEEWDVAEEWECVGAEVRVEVHDADGAGCEGAVVAA